MGYLAPSDKDPTCKRLPRFDGLAAFLDKVVGHDPDYVPTETMMERKARIVCLCILILGAREEGNTNGA